MNLERKKKKGKREEGRKEGKGRRGGRGRGLQYWRSTAQFGKQYRQQKVNTFLKSKERRRSPPSEKKAGSFRNRSNT